MRIGFIGAGQMATALAHGFVNKQLAASKDLIASDCLPASRSAFQETFEGASVTSDNAAVVAQSEIVILAVKPQHLPDVLAGIPSASKCLFVSIIAGVKLSQLSDGLGTRRIVRVMPNTPCLIGRGASAFCCGEEVSEKDQENVRGLLDSVGDCWQLPEAQLDAVTGLSGSGPAFVYLFIEALSDGGVKMGLPRNVATQLAAATVAGAAQMVLDTGAHPGELKDRVASPGGTTIAGIAALEEASFRSAAIEAVTAATRRSKELGG